MRIIAHPKLHNMWTETYDCKCGAKLEASPSDIQRRTIPERQGVDITYYLVCPVCKTERILHRLPDNVRHIIDMVASGKMSKTVLEEPNTRSSYGYGR